MLDSCSHPDLPFAFAHPAYLSLSTNPSRACSMASSGFTSCFLPAGVRGAPQDVKLVRDPAIWLGYQGRWGSSVVAPQLQEWFQRAENPVSRTWIQQVGQGLLWMAAMFCVDSHGFARHALEPCSNSPRACGCIAVCLKHPQHPAKLLHS